MGVRADQAGVAAVSVRTNQELLERLSDDLHLVKSLVMGAITEPKITTPRESEFPAPLIQLWASGSGCNSPGRRI